jgi:hypothetical protein
MITPNDIGYFYSGGAGNMNPELSLGGLPSVHTIPAGNINNLFDNITDSQRMSGMIDYRCIYIANVHQTDSLYQTYAKIPGQITGGANVLIGYKLATDIQTITFTSPFPSSYILQYNNGTTTLTFNIPDLTVASLQTALEGIFPGVYVSGAGTTLTIQFIGSSQYHYFYPFTSPTANVTTAKFTDGGPINYYPMPPLDSKYTTPGGILFGIDTLVGGALALHEFKQGEVFYLWCKRTVQAGVTQQDNDGFTISIAGNVFA